MTKDTPSSVCDMQGEREAFEAWAGSLGSWIPTVKKDTNGRYQSLTTASAWSAWQARAALERPAERTQQEALTPAAWLYRCGSRVHLREHRLDHYFSMDGETFVKGEPLYTRPSSAADCSVPMQPSDPQILKAYELGFLRAAEWTNRDDLRADLDSGAYAKDRARDLGPMLAAPTQATGGEGFRDRLQKQCSDWGAYWRAPDSHGVELTKPQAVELLADVLGVEVEIKDAAAPAAVDGDAKDAEPLSPGQQAALERQKRLVATLPQTRAQHEAIESHDRKHGIGDQP